MYQITAIYENCEVAYAEGGDYWDCMLEVVEQVQNSFYAPVIGDVQYSSHKEGACFSFHGYLSDVLDYIK